MYQIFLGGQLNKNISHFLHFVPDIDIFKKNEAAFCLGEWCTIIIIFYK